MIEVKCEKIGYKVTKSMKDDCVCVDCVHTRIDTSCGVVGLKCTFLKSELCGFYVCSINRRLSTVETTIMYDIDYSDCKYYSFEFKSLHKIVQLF